MKKLFRYLAITLSIVTVCGLLFIGTAAWLFAPKIERFASYGQLQQSGLIEKGWITGFIPQDAYAIVHTHDLDNNEAVTEFSYTSALRANPGENWRPVSQAALGRRAADGWEFKHGPDIRYFAMAGPTMDEFVAIDANTRRVLHWVSNKR